MPRAHISRPDTPSRCAVPGRKLSTTTSAVASELDRAPARAAGSLQIERDALLAAIEQQVVDAAAVDERRQVPHRIAAARILDLDDLRAELREHERRERARQQARQVEDANPSVRASSVRVEAESEFMSGSTTSARLLLELICSSSACCGGSRRRNRCATPIASHQPNRSHAVRRQALHRVEARRGAGERDEPDERHAERPRPVADP